MDTVVSLDERLARIARATATLQNGHHVEAHDSRGPPVDPVSEPHAGDAATAEAVELGGRASTYTRYPNVVSELGERMGLDPIAFTTLFHLIRLTGGFHREHTDIGLVRLAKRVQVTKPSIVAALERLEGHRLIERTRRTDQFGRTMTTLIKVTLPEE